MFARISSLPRRFVLLTLLLVGLLCGLGAVAFHHLIYLSRASLIVRALHLDGIWRPLFVVIVPTAVAALLAWIVSRYVPSAAKANLGMVRQAYAQDASKLNLKTVLATFVLTPVSLGSGIPLGPEGPTTVVTSGIAVHVSKLIGLPRRIVRGMIPVGTAAGIAAIFNTPITGVVFALEEVLGTTSRGLLGGTIVAAVAAAVVQRFLLGGDHVLATAPASWEHVWELGAFALVGVLCGVASGLMIPAVRRLSARLATAVPNLVWRAALAGSVVGIIGIFAPATLSVGYESTANYLHGGGTLYDASLNFAGKLAAVIMSLASGLLGGTFAPSLFLGASLGAAIGHGADLLLPGAAIGAARYAFVGMGSFFSGLVRAPISAVLIVVELTGEYDLILPLMLATALSTAISRRISPMSLTEHQLRDDGFRDEHAVVHDPLAIAKVSEVMTSDPLRAVDTMTFREAAAAFGAARHRLYPVVNLSGRLVGTLAGDAIRSAVNEGRLEVLIAAEIRPVVLTARPEDNLQDLVRLMKTAGIDRCPVVDADEVLVGFVAPEDMVRVRMAKLDDAAPDREFDMLDTD
jgi:chloride channel protein, CIC family